MAKRTVDSCDFCKREVECRPIPLAGGDTFEVCQECFDAKELAPLMAAARRARESTKQGQIDYYSQYFGRYDGPGHG